LKRRDVEVADQDRALAIVWAQLLHRGELIEKGELVGEFLVNRRVGLVAARRYIEIVQCDRVTQPGRFAKPYRDVTAVLLAAVILDGYALEGKPREHRDAVIALLAIERRMRVAEPAEA